MEEKNFGEYTVKLGTFVNIYEKSDMKGVKMEMFETLMHYGEFELCAKYVETLLAAFMKALPVVLDEVLSEEDVDRESIYTEMNTLMSYPEVIRKGNMEEIEPILEKMKEIFT